MYSDSAADTTILQLFCNSAAFLLFAILHVSSQGTGHMGTLVWMYTWFVCYQLGQFGHICPRSTQVHPRSNSKVPNSGTALREQIRHGTTAGTFSTPRRQQGIRSNHRFTPHDDRFLQMCTELPACCCVVKLVKL